MTLRDFLNLTEKPWLKVVNKTPNNIYRVAKIFLGFFFRFSEFLPSFQKFKFLVEF